MKILKIKIQDRKTYEQDLKNLARALDNNEDYKKYKKFGIYFESLAAVRKILTDNRLDVWRAIRDKSPESITELAQILNRDFRSVHRDVMLLSSLELIKLTEGPGKRGNVIKLKSLCDELQVSVA